MLVVRLVDVRQRVSIPVARVSMGKKGVTKQIVRNLAYYVVGHIRLITDDTVRVSVFSFDGDFANLIDAGHTRPTSKAQLAKLCVGEANDLTKKLRAQLKGTAVVAAKERRIKMHLAAAATKVALLDPPSRSPPGRVVRLIPLLATSSTTCETLVS
jgi:hypothetical protein